MHVYAFLCRHFLYTIPDQKAPRPRRTCDNKKMYCDACLTERLQFTQENSLSSCLQSLEALQINDVRNRDGPGSNKATLVDNLDKLLESLSLKEDIGSSIQALQHKLRLDVDAFVEKHGEDVTIAIVKHALKAWENQKVAQR